MILLKAYHKAYMCTDGIEPISPLQVKFSGVLHYTMCAYVINAGLSYNSFSNGINAGIFYNVKGPTLFIVGGGLFPDIYTQPFHSLNFSFNKKLGKDQKTSIDFQVSNILNSKIQELYQAYNAEPQPFTIMSPGTAFSVGASYKI